MLDLWFGHKRKDSWFLVKISPNNNIHWYQSFIYCKWWNQKMVTHMKCMEPCRLWSQKCVPVWQKPLVLVNQQKRCQILAPLLTAFLCLWWESCYTVYILLPYIRGFLALVIKIMRMRSMILFGICRLVKILLKLFVNTRIILRDYGWRLWRRNTINRGSWSCCRRRGWR